jgi:large subunit ribosomal protein L18e
MEKISKSKIERRLGKKINPYLVETIIKFKKINPIIAKILATPKKKSIKINLEELDKKCKEGDKIVFPGKILSSGELTKKIKLIAWSASKGAMEKMKRNKIEFSTLYEELKDIKKLNEYRLLR